MDDLRFTESHEWVRVEGHVATIGITKYAIEQLGDVTLIELPEAGRVVASGAEAAVIESVKAASEIYSPVGGEVTESNTAVTGNLDSIRENPEQAWLFCVKMADPAEVNRLMTRAQYEAYLKGL